MPAIAKRSRVCGCSRLWGKVGNKQVLFQMSSFGAFVTLNGI